MKCGKCEFARINLKDDEDVYYCQFDNEFAFHSGEECRHPFDMSIEKLTHEKQCFIDEGWDDTGELEAYDMAVNIMRKYQKIEDIYYHQSGEALENSLRAVIEDGINYEKRTFNNEER